MEKSYPILGVLRTYVLPWLAALFPVITPLTVTAGLIGPGTTQSRGFIQNVGQVLTTHGEQAEEISFYLKKGDLTVFFRKGGISYVSSERAEKISEATGKAESQWKAGTGNEVVSQHRFDVELRNHNRKAKPAGENPMKEYINFYVPEYPEGIRALQYESVIYNDVYAGIDLRFYLNEDGNLKYDFIVKPGADPAEIEMVYEGTGDMYLNEHGELEVFTTGGRLTEQAPYTYTSDQKFVSSSYLLSGNTLRFRIGRYDDSKTLIIDPTLIWSTYFGSSGDDLGLAISGDISGNVYATGYTTSTTFPVSTGAQQVSNGGLSDAFVTKFDNAGNRLWTTYFGGTGEDRGYDVETDGSANVFVTGYSQSANFPVSIGAFQTSNGGIADAFLLKFNPAGALQFATLIGGASDDYGYALAADANGDIYLAGNSQSNNFPVVSALQSTLAGGADAFISKFSTLGVPYWITYFGGSLGDEAYGMTLDASGHPIITGRSFSGNFPVTSGAYQSAKAGGDDVIVAKFTPAGTLTWATYYGGSADDYGYEIIPDASGNLYLSGYTASSDFPVTTGAHQTTYGGGLFDGFVTKLTSTGGQVWSTYFGGSDNDQSYSISAEPSGVFHISGLTASTNLTVTGDAYQATKSTGNDAFIASFDAGGSLSWSTYFGGNNDDYGYDILWNTPASLLQVAGATISTNFPVTGNAFQGNNAGSIDMFLSAFCSSISNNIVDVNGGDSTEICVNGPYPTITGSSPSGTGPFAFQWQSSTNGSTFTNITGATGQNHNPATVGVTTWFRRVVTNPICADTSNVVKVTVNAPPVAAIAVSQGCVGHVTSFTSLSTTASATDTIVSYAWNFGDGNTSSQPNPGHTYASPGNYTVTLIVTTVTGCTDTTQTNIQVDTQPIVDFSIQANCTNNTITATDLTTPTTGYIAFWNWSFGDNNYANIQNPTHTYASPGTYVIWLIATTNGGCADTLIDTITVGSPVTAGFSFTAACAGSPTQFTNTSTGSTSFWNWDFGDGNTSTSQNPSHTFSAAGTYTVTLITGSQGCVDTVTQTVSIGSGVLAGFTTDATCLGQTVNFTDTSSVFSGTITSWAWDFGDGGTSTSQHPVHTYASNGTYTVTLTVTATGGCASTISKQVTIGTAPTAAFTMSGNCAGQTLTFFDNSTGNPSSWYWNFGDGTDAVLQNPVHFYNAGGTYTVTLIVSNGTCTDTLTQNVTVLDGPTASFNFTGACNGSVVSFTNTSTTTGGTITSYNWNFGNGSTSSSANPTTTYPGVGTYIVRLIVTTSSGCADTITQPITVEPDPVAAFSTTNACLNQTVQFIDNSTSGGPVTSWFWNFGDGNTSTQQNPTHLYQSGTSFPVMLVVTTANGCTDTVTNTVTLHPSPVASFDVGGANCVGSESVFTDNSAISSGSITSWNWSFGDGQSSQEQNPVVVYNTAGTYTVQLVVTSSTGCTDTVTQQVTIAPPPVVNAGTDVTIMAGNSVQLNATSTPTGNFFWSPASGLSAVNVHNPTASPLQTTTYVVTVFTANGCRGTDTITVNVRLDLEVPSAFTPNDDGSNDSWEPRNFRMFPGAVAQVFNRWGTEIYNSEQTADAWDGTYKGEPLPAGAYFYVIDLKDGSEPIKGTVTLLK